MPIAFFIALWNSSAISGVRAVAGIGPVTGICAVAGIGPVRIGGIRIRTVGIRIGPI